MENIDDLVTVIASIKNKKELQQFLEEIMTDAERKDLALRWELMKQLNSGVPQRKIAEDLGISLCKITRGSKILKDKGSATSRILNADKSAPKN
jgi:TrpR family trp operon transcriptional repressor